MKKIKITIQYDGSQYSGWQIQLKDKTIQGILEKAVLTVTGEQSRVNGAGRTDAGVHALEQVAAFSTESRLDSPTMLRALNANLPNDIQIITAEEVPEDFHPRYRAKHKTYSYLITTSNAYSVFLNKYSWHTHYSLHIDAMLHAAQYLLGKQDFSSFRGAGCGSKHPVREITDITVSKLDSIDFMSFHFKAPLIRIRMTGNAFLRHMVRNIAGTLVQIGRDKTPPEQMRNILDAKDRQVAGPTAPASGLFLESIEY